MQKSLFQAEKISDRITRIHLPGEVFSYLVEGEKKAVLIDTGCGIGDLRGFVEGLTEKPLTVLLTHGHVDHAPGAVQFEDVYMNLLDSRIFQEHNILEKRKGYAESVSEKVPFTEADMLPVGSCERFRQLSDGDCFDLGGLQVTAYACGGHTPGSMVFLIQEEGYLLLGDACNPFTFLFDKSCLGVASYERSLLALQGKVQGRYEKVLISHGEGTASRDMLEENYHVCEAIKRGDVVNIHFEFQGRKAFLAKPQGRRNEFGEEMANIAYNPDRIYE